MFKFVKPAFMLAMVTVLLQLASPAQASDRQFEQWHDPFDLTYIAGKTAGAAAVNFWVVGNALTGTGPLLQAEGSDANISPIIKGKGTGTPILQDGSGASLLTTVKTTTAVNNVQLTNSATGNAPDVAAVGTDSNVSLTFTPKGTGSVKAQLGGSTSYGGVVAIASMQVSATGVACTAGSTDDTLFTYTLPANTLKNVGDYVQISAWGTGVATASTSKIFFGGTAFVTDGGVTSASPIVQKITVVKTAANTQIVFTDDNYHGTTANIARVVPTTAAITDTSAIIIKSTANSGAATTLGNGLLVVVGHQ